MSDWEPDRYLHYADERSRPFADLLSRVAASDPARVVDLGCGPGTLTAGLASRWPSATVLGLDTSPAMIEAAAGLAGPRLSFARVDLRHWATADPVDVLISNATLQWVPGHQDLLSRLAGFVRPGGWFAFAVPGNFAAPSHRLLRDLAGDERFRAHTESLVWPTSADPEDYLADLSGFGEVDAWETTYLHVLTGEDPVFTWISATGARPVLQALPERLRAVFERDFRSALRDAYPHRAYGVVLPFRRVFVVLRRTPGAV